MIIDSNNKKTKKTLLKAFTLIEILVVVSIIGIITAIVMTNLNSAKDKATDIKSVTELDQLRKALELYRTDNGKYPGEDNSVYNEFAPDDSVNTEQVCPAVSWFDTTTLLTKCTTIDEGGDPVPLVNNPYKGSISTLFKSELVDKGYISAVPYYVTDINDFDYRTGNEAKVLNCGGQNYSSYLITFTNQNYNLKLTQIFSGGTEQNCANNNSCYYCFGY